MGLGTRMTRLASKMCTKYGAACTLTRKSGGTFNAVLQATTGGTSASDTFKAVLEEYSAHEVDGDTIRYGDKKVMVPVSALTNLLAPAPDDTMDILGEKYRVVSATGISSGDAIVAYSVQVRK